LLVLYYPQDTPEELGPTGIVPGSHYYNTPDGAKIHEEFPVCGEAGTVAIVNYDLWHRAMPNRTDKKRYMMKFLFARMSEPESPSWNNQQREWLGTSDEGQRMWQHVWEWHHGMPNRVMAKNGTTCTDSISNLIEALGNDSESIGLNAAYALSEFGDKAVPALIESLGDASEKMRRNACYALSAMGTPAVDALMGALRDSNWQVRDGAAETLGDIGLHAQVATPALIDAVQDDSEQVRGHAAEALGTTSQMEPTATPALISALQDEDGRVRRTAMLALARLGPHAAEAVSALREALEDENRYVRGDAVHVLQRIGTPTATDILLRFLTMSRWCPSTTRESTH
jgi:HEAT repeat protein